MAGARIARRNLVAMWVASIRGWFYWPFVLVLVGGGALLSMLAAREFDAGDWTRWDYVLFCGTAINAAALVGLQVIRDRGQRITLQEFRAKMRTDFGAALDAAVDEIGGMASLRTRPKRDAAYGKVVTLLVGAAVELTGPGEGRMRATFFEYRPAGAEGEGLYAMASVGREKSTFNFLAGRPIGDEALHMVKEREYLFNPDVAASPPSGWTRGKPAKYAAFLSVACAIHGKPIGMLTVDSTDSADIDEDDVSMLTLVGRLLGVAYLVRG